jgi:glutamate--cysteine ligase
VNDKMQEVINRVRDPDLILKMTTGAEHLKDASTVLLDRLQVTAELLDKVHGSSGYSRSVNAQREKVEDPERTPSARILQALRTSGYNHSDWILLKSREHKEKFKNEPPDRETMQKLMRHAAASIEKQNELEAANGRSFDEFLADFLAIEISD